MQPRSAESYIIDRMRLQAQRETAVLRMRGSFLAARLRLDVALSDQNPANKSHGTVSYNCTYLSTILPFC